MSSLSAFFSSFVPTVYAESSEEDKQEDKQEESPQDQEQEAKDKDEGGEEEEEEEEEEDPEDEHPTIRAECAESKDCAPLKAHFDHCQEKIESGKGFKGEDCVEELCKSGCCFNPNSANYQPCQRALMIYSVHLLHCQDNCAAPRLFHKLR